jgi:DNA replication protein DnaC
MIGGQKATMFPQSPRLLVIDEIGYLPFGREETGFLL